MAKTKNVDAPEVNESKEKKTEIVEETKFPYSELRKNSYKLFGVHKEIFDGAMYGKDKNGFYTKSECLSNIATFKNKKV